MAVDNGVRAASEKTTGVPPMVSLRVPQAPASDPVAQPSEPIPPGTDPPPATVDNGPVFTPTDPQWQPDEPPWVGPGVADATGWDWFGIQRIRTWYHEWFPPSNGRYRAIGIPLEHESWLNRPISVSFLTGALFDSNPVRGKLDGTPGYLIGFRAGWDVEHFWGVETRFAFSTYGLSSLDSSVLPSKMKTFLWDTDFLYYPWGDTKWRPFALLGFGLADYRWQALNLGAHYHQTTLDVPFGVGLKYRHNNRWVFRVDLIDNLSFDSGQSLSTMSNFSITAGLEARLGIGPRRSYWPWNPARSYR